MAYVSMATNEEGFTSSSQEVSEKKGELQSVELLDHKVSCELTVEDVDQTVINFKSTGDSDFKNAMEFTKFMMDQCAQMENSLKLQSNDNPGKQEVFCMINKQLQLMKNLHENLKTVRHDLGHHIFNIREHLASRELDIAKYIDEMFCKEAEKVLSNIKRLTQHAQEADGLDNSMTIDEKLHDIKEVANGIKGMSFKPLYSIDIGMVLKSDENVDYDLTGFRNCCNINADNITKDGTEDGTKDDTKDDIKDVTKDGTKDGTKDDTTADSTDRGQKHLSEYDIQSLVAKKLTQLAQSTPQQNVPQRSVLQESALQHSAPQESPPEKSVPQQSAPQNVATNDIQKVLTKHGRLSNDPIPQLPAKSAKLISNLAANRRRKSLSRKGIGYLSIHRNDRLVAKPGHTDLAKQKIDTEEKSQAESSSKKPSDEQNEPSVSGKAGGAKKRAMERQHAVIEKATKGKKNAKQKFKGDKEVCFVETSEENVYAKSHGMEGFLEMLKNNREKKAQQEKPIEYEEVTFKHQNKSKSSPKKDNHSSEKTKGNTELPEKTRVKKSPELKEKPRRKEQGTKEQREDAAEPPLPPRLYRIEDTDIEEANAKEEKNEGKKATERKTPPPRPNVPSFEAKKEKKTISDKTQVNSETENKPPVPAAPRPTTKDKKPQLKLSNPSSIPASSSLAQMKEICRALSPDVLDSICFQGLEAMKSSKKSEPPLLPTPPDRWDSMQSAITGTSGAARDSAQVTSQHSRKPPARSPSDCDTLLLPTIDTRRASEESLETIYDNVQNWLTVPFLWEQTVFSDVTSVVCLSDTRVVLLDGNWLRFLTRTGNMTARCELKQLTNGGPLRMSCSKTDTVVVSSPLLKKILMVPTTGTKVKGSLYTIPDVLPEFTSIIDTGYIVGGKLKVKGDWKPGVTVLDNKLVSKTKWQVTSRISEMATASKTIYLCLQDLHSVAAYNFQGTWLHTFGDRQTLYRPMSICINLNGDVIVTHSASEDDPDFQLSSWSPGGSKQMDLLIWNKTKEPPAIACHGNKLVLAREKTVSCYQISF